MVASAVKKACPDYDFNMMAPSFILLSDDIMQFAPDLQKVFLPWSLDALFDGGYDTSFIKDISVHK